jgi:hypothetical protein
VSAFVRIGLKDGCLVIHGSAYPPEPALAAGTFEPAKVA